MTENIKILPIISALILAGFGVFYSNYSYSDNRILMDREPSIEINFEVLSKLDKNTNYSNKKVVQEQPKYVERNNEPEAPIEFENNEQLPVNTVQKATVKSISDDSKKQQSLEKVKKSASPLVADNNKKMVKKSDKKITVKELSSIENANIEKTINKNKPIEKENKLVVNPKKAKLKPEIKEKKLVVANPAINAKRDNVLKMQLPKLRAPAEKGLSEAKERKSISDDPLGNVKSNFAEKPKNTFVKPKTIIQAPQERKIVQIPVQKVKDVIGKKTVISVNKAPQTSVIKPDLSLEKSAKKNRFFFFNRKQTDEKNILDATKNTSDKSGIVEIAKKDPAISALIENDIANVNKLPNTRRKIRIPKVSEIETVDRNEVSEVEGNREFVSLAKVENLVEADSLYGETISSSENLFNKQLAQKKLKFNSLKQRNTAINSRDYTSYKGEMASNDEPNLIKKIDDFREVKPVIIKKRQDEVAKVLESKKDTSNKDKLIKESLIINEKQTDIAKVIENKKPIAKSPLAKTQKPKEPLKVAELSKPILPNNISKIINDDSGAEEKSKSVKVESANNPKPVKIIKLENPVKKNFEKKELKKVVDEPKLKIAKVAEIPKFLPVLPVVEAVDLKEPASEPRKDKVYNHFDFIFDNKKPVKSDKLASLDNNLQKPDIIDEKPAISFLFDEEGSELEPSDINALSDLVSKLSKADKIKIVSYSVEGAFNNQKRISLRRAIKIRNELLQKGVETDKIEVKAAVVTKSPSDANKLEIFIVKDAANKII